MNCAHGEILQRVALSAEHRLRNLATVVLAQAESAVGGDTDPSVLAECAAQVRAVGAALGAFARDHRVEARPCSVEKLVVEGLASIAHLVPLTSSIEPRVRSSDSKRGVLADLDGLRRVVLTWLLACEIPEGAARASAAARVRPGANGGRDRLEVEISHRLALSGADLEAACAAVEAVSAASSAGSFGMRFDSGGDGRPILRLTWELLDASDSARVSHPAASASAGAVLIVDDDRQVRAVIASMLSGLGLGILQAGSCEEGCALFARDPDRIRLVVLDYDLPDKSGDRCLSEMRSSCPNTPAVLISGLPSAGDIVQDDPRASFLEKPFRAAELRALALAALREHEREG